MKNLILILVAALFAFNVSAQTERAGQKPTSVKLEQKEVKKVDNSGGKTEKVVLVIDLLNMDTESKILKILKRIEGILHVELNVREKTATISYDTKIVHVKEIIAALAKEKYDSKIASTNEKVVVLQVVMKVKGDEIKIEEILKSTKGVKKVVMNLKQGTATVTFDGEKTKPELMVEELKKSGFDSKIVS